MTLAATPPTATVPTPRIRTGVPAWMRPAPAMFLLAWGGNHVTPLLHLYETTAHLAAWQANLLLGVYVAGLVPGLLIASAVSDRSGRKPVMLAGVLLSLGGSALLAIGVQQLALLLVGRALAGAGVGIAMSVGTSWMKELSSAPFDPRATASAGARRPSLTLTLGFALGAGVTGALAQWAPLPTMLPYLVHGALTLLAGAALLTAPESLPRGHRTTAAWWRELRVPAAGHRRFTRLVLPAAPWVFAAAGVAYAIMPAVVEHRLGDRATLYATVLTLLTLGSGALAQPFVPRLNRATGGRSLAVGLGLMALGMLLAVVGAVVGDPVLALGVAVVLGVAYGITVVSGLTIVQAIAGPGDLAGLTGVYYSLTYLGFLLPTLLAALLPVAPYGASLAAVSAVCVACAVVVAVRIRRPD